MRTLSHFVGILLLGGLAVSAYAADVIDRVVATVNGHVILQSDWDDAVRFEAFVDGRPLDQITAANVKDLKVILNLHRVPLFIACGRNTTSAQTAQALTQALEAATKDGTIKRITQQYDF